MKTVLLLLLTVHGLIHLMGFAKAFGYARLEALRGPVSRPMGLLWLAAALLLVTAAALVLLAPKLWWWAGAAGLVLSQLAIVSSWKDARFGTLANLLLLLPVALAALEASPASPRPAFEQAAKELLARPPAAPRQLTEADLAPLPSAVQRYLRFAGAVGKPRVWNYRLRFRGGLREGPKDAWMPVEVQQLSTVRPPARLFLAQTSKLGLPVAAFHRYVGSAASFQVKLASLFTVVDAHGEEMTRSETVTLLNDLCLLAPAALADSGLSWREVDADRVEVGFSNAGHTVTAQLLFDPTGALLDFISDDRSRSVDGKVYQRLRWSTPIEAWRDFDGRKLPVSAEARWSLPEGEFAYARFEILEAAYNVESLEPQSELRWF